VRVVALTFGTEGDMRPMVALCRGLRDADVDTVLLGDRSAAACAAQYGVPLVALAGDMAEALREAAGGFPAASLLVG